MRITIEFNIGEREVSLVRPDGTLVQMFPTDYLLNGGDPSDEELVGESLRSAICTLMADSGYDLWELTGE